MQPNIYSVGHSTHSAEAFLELLSGQKIELLADIRRFPGSRRLPHFNQENLAPALRAAGIDYHWFTGLGGRRPKSATPSDANAGLRNASFRNYGDYMQTSEFRQGIDELLNVAAGRATAMMCSESVFWRCHRRLVSDYLLASGIVVQHIMPSGDVRPHTLTTGAVVRDGRVTYPASQEELQPRLFE